MNKWCDKCGREIVRQGDIFTWYDGKKVCECEENKTNKFMKKCDA